METSVGSFLTEDHLLQSGGDGGKGKPDSGLESGAGHRLAGAGLGWMDPRQRGGH